MIEVRHLSKSFGPVAAVRDLSFDAPDRTITGFLGANGAGKTTTLKAIAGVLQPDAGTVQVGARNGGEKVHSPLGVLLDHHGLYPRLTTREHLAFFGRLRGLTGSALADRVEEILVMLGLTEIADRRTSGFSQGERMKVSLGCAIVHAPGHLLLDEPTNGLDVPTVRAFRALLKQLRDSGTCILFSSHVLSEIEGLCDRVVIIARGMLVAEGSLEDVRRRAEVAGLEDAFVKLTAVAGGSV
jgi:sodium transport system ATP-binding protein